MDLSTRYYLLRLLEQDSGWTQRALARELGVSVGKAHYCLKQLVDRDWVKVICFKDEQKRPIWRYRLTRDGRTAREQLSRRFLKRKLVEYESLKSEIQALRDEVDSQGPAGPAPRPTRK